MSTCGNHYGAQCNFSCAIGYRLNGSSTVTCVAPGNQHPGVWNNTIPTCEGKLENVTSFKIKLKWSEANSPNTTTHLLCSGPLLNRCYRQRQIMQEAVVTDKYMRHLLKIIYSYINIIAAIMCPVLPAPSSGTRLGCPGNATMYYNTVCQFSCNDGYIGSGSQARRCQHNGTWSGQDFTCQGM